MHRRYISVTQLKGIDKWLKINGCQGRVYKHEPRKQTQNINVIIQGTRNVMNAPKRHFLVIAAASRGARFFVKKALEQGHNVTALCRAENDKNALIRMNEILESTQTTPSRNRSAEVSGKLTAHSLNILSSETYRQLLNDDRTIDAIACFVGVTKVKDMMSRKTRLYTNTMKALVDGMNQSRLVEVFYHSSVGSEGVPGASETRWPANYPIYSPLIHRIFPVFRDVTRSENVLASIKKDGGQYIIFRPAGLTDDTAKRHYGYSFDTTGLYKEDFPLSTAKTTICREDVAEEILRVATLDQSERTHWHGHGVYLADLK